MLYMYSCTHVATVNVKGLDMWSSCCGVKLQLIVLFTVCVRKIHVGSIHVKSAPKQEDSFL